MFLSNYPHSNLVLWQNSHQVNVKIRLKTCELCTEKIWPLTFTFLEHRCCSLCVYVFLLFQFPLHSFYILQIMGLHSIWNHILHFMEGLIVPLPQFLFLSTSICNFYSGMWPILYDLIAVNTVASACLYYLNICGSSPKGCKTIEEKTKIILGSAQNYCNCHFCHFCFFIYLFFWLIISV